VEITTLEGALLRIEELETRNAYLQKRNGELEARIEKLERMLLKDSSNSSKPPSSNPPWHKLKYPERPLGEGKAGAKKGHKGHFRVRLKKVDVIETHRPHHCKHCQGAFCEGSYVLQSKVTRHQVIEIPEPKVLVTEHRLMRYRCRGCDRVTQAKLPSEVSRHTFGPRLTALIATLCTEQRLSVRQVTLFLQEQYGVQVSTGTISACVRRSGHDVRGAADEALLHIQNAPVKNADETSWFQKHTLHWLWVGCTKGVSVFLIDKRRNQEAAHRLLGKTDSERQGVLGADRYGGYAWWKKRRRQHCWAHLRREFIAMSQRRDASRLIGEKLTEITDAIFALQRQMRASDICKDTFDRKLRPLQKDCVLYLRLGKRTQDKDTVRICKSLLKDFRCLWVFAQDPIAIDCHNNESERSLRHAVITRKLSHGTQSEQGSRDKAVLLTVQGSCRKQNRSVFRFLYDSLTAHQIQKPGPSLVTA